jgi:E3 ubiquitin-protein ligase HERC2
VQDLLQISAGKDLTVELSAPQYRGVMEFITTHLRVGKFVLNEVDEKGLGQQILVPLTHFNSERTLAYLLGLRASFLQKATDLQPAEQQCRSILQSQILSGGLQVLQPTNPFDEEKGEARSGCSTAGSTPTEPTNHPPGQEMRTMTNWPSMMISQRVDALLYGLGEGRTTDPMVSAWIVLTDRYCRENRTMWQQEFMAENTVMELERLLMAVLIRHQSLGPLVLAVIDRGK